MFAEILTVLSMIPGFASMFKKRPSAPSYDELGMSEEERKRIMSSIERRINKGVGESIGDVRNTAASRGGYRSGQLPMMEQRIRSGGTDSLADAMARLTEGNVERRFDWAKYKYGQDVSGYRSGQEAGGQGFGMGLSNLVAMLGQGKYGGRNTSAGGGGGSYYRSPFKLKGRREY